MSNGNKKDVSLFQDLEDFLALDFDFLSLDSGDESSDSKGDDSDGNQTSKPKELNDGKRNRKSLQTFNAVKPAKGKAPKESDESDDSDDNESNDWPEPD